MATQAPLPLPREWSQVVQSGVLHAISLASSALTTAWARGAECRVRTAPGCPSDAVGWVFGKCVPEAIIATFESTLAVSGKPLDQYTLPTWRTNRPAGDH